MTAAALRVAPPSRLIGRRIFAVAFGAGLLSVAAASCASAQVTLPGAPVGAGNVGTGPHARSAAEKPLQPAPDAIPGARAREPAAPATRLAGDMQPTDALFDAINRGDIAAARDSLNRGADLNGVNVLGMTPMELSVDLGRNDISFLLLSMRGEDSGRGSRAVGRDNKTPATKTVQTSNPAPPTPAKAGRVAPQAAKPVATPKLFANDGGSPLPGSGFLGFGSKPTAN